MLCALQEVPLLCEGIVFLLVVQLPPQQKQWLPDGVLFLQSCHNIR